jgi:hypothetical protein
LRREQVILGGPSRFAARQSWHNAQAFGSLAARRISTTSTGGLNFRAEASATSAESPLNPLT